MKTTDNTTGVDFWYKQAGIIREQRDAAVAALRSMVAVFNVKDIDPLQAFVAIEQAQGAIAATQGNAQ